MRSELLDAARALSPVPVQEYLRSRGFSLDAQAAAFAIYRRGDATVDVPSRPDLADYPRRLIEVLEIVAALEDTTLSALVETLAEPPGDTLAIRLATATTSLGTVPLADALRVREAAKTMVLAAAHSALLPQSYFPRLSRGPAVELLASVREGQTHRGSFISRFIVPVGPAIGPGEALDPYGRRVVRLLMSALEEVRQVRSLGGYNELLSREKSGVSGNLLAALVTLSPAIEGGSLDISVTWSRNRAAPADVAGRVVFGSEALRGLDAVAEAMRERAQTSGFEIVGYVTRLDRKVRDPGAEGDVVIVPHDDTSDLGSVHVHLDAASYAKAVDAHREGSVVRVVGTLSKTGRRWTLASATGFDIVPADVDDILGTVGS